MGEFLGLAFWCNSSYSDMDCNYDAEGQNSVCAFDNINQLLPIYDKIRENEPETKYFELMVNHDDTFITYHDLKHIPELEKMARPLLLNEKFETIQ